MSINNRLLHTPDGVRDIMPAEYVARAAVERKIEIVFESFGFTRVSSPMFEYADVFDEKGSVTQSAIYKFIDRDGSVLALRSDVTPQIARMVSTTCRPEDVPFRFSYLENAFRYNESYQGKLKEFTQAGVELIGVDSEDASAEVVALAVKSLLASGLHDFRIDIGQVQFFQGILEEGGFDESSCRYMQQSIIGRDYVAVEKAAQAANAPETVQRVLSELPLLIGGVEVLTAARGMTANEKALSALSNLESIYAVLCEYGVEEYIAFDLSMVGHLDYYTGIIFRGYAYGTGSSVLDGGRYDNLLMHFGTDYPSVGFGIKVGVLMDALNGKAPSPHIAPDTLLVYTSEGRHAALSAANELRAQGLRIENCLLTDFEAYAKKHGHNGVLYFSDADNVTLIDYINHTERTVRISALLSGEGVV